MGDGQGLTVDLESGDSVIVTDSSGQSQVLTIADIEQAAQHAAANHGAPTQIYWSTGNGKSFNMWNGIFPESKWENTPYENFQWLPENLEKFANMHLLLLKLKVCKYSPKDNYNYLNDEGATRIKKIRAKPTEKTLRRIKRREKRRQEDEKLPYYKRSVSRNTRGCI